MLKFAQKSTLMVILLFVAACARPSAFNADGVPTEMARVEDLDQVRIDQDLFEEDIANLEQYGGEDFGPNPQEDSPSTALPVTPAPTGGSIQNPPASSPSPAAKAPGWKAVLDVAKWVMRNEGDRVGKACNYYIQRVFERMGFGKGSWTANEFDKYVERTFSYFKVKTFSQATPAKDRKELQEYLWSQPERTGFVFQWKRQGPHGHVAFVQRIKNELVIYHASLNKFKPKAQRVTIDVLLYKGGAQNKLLVFSHFQNKK